MQPCWTNQKVSFQLLSALTDKKKNLEEDNYINSKINGASRGDRMKRTPDSDSTSKNT